MFHWYFILDAELIYIYIYLPYRKSEIHYGRMWSDWIIFVDLIIIISETGRKRKKPRSYNVEKIVSVQSGLRCRAMIITSHCLLQACIRREKKKCRLPNRKACTGENDKYRCASTWPGHSWIFQDGERECNGCRVRMTRRLYRDKWLRDENLPN